MLTRTLLDPPRHHPDSCAAGSDGVVGCRICVDTCPYAALRPRTSAGRTVIEVDASNCERCGACTAVCPTSSMKRAFLPADELRSLALAAVDGGRPLAFVGDHHGDAVEGLADAGWGVVELPSVLIVDTTLLVAAHLAGAPAIAVLGCPACHHDTLGVVSDAASNAAALTTRYGATLVADISVADIRPSLAELLAASPRRTPLSTHQLTIDDADRTQRQQLNPGAPSWLDGAYDLETVEGAPEHGGVHVSRVGTKNDVTYEETTEYRRKVDAGEDPYPSERPWYPFTHAGITTEALAAIATGYPYTPKVYISYFINQLHSIPGGRRFREVLQDPDQLPLFIAVDTTISETSVNADYIVPDAMYLDGQYGFMGQGVGAVSAEHLGIRTPAVEPLTGRTDDGRPMLMETFLIDVALRLGLPGYGDDAILGMGPHDGERFPLRTAEDYYLRGIANVAFNAGTPAAPDDEREWVEAGYPVAAHRDILPADEWTAAAYLLARGGYFEDPDAAWDDDGQHTSGLKVNAVAPLQIWHETLATTVNPALGRKLPGCATYLPAEDGTGQRLEDIDADYPFHVVTFRLPTRTKARTAYDYWATEIHPRNHVEMNPADAGRLGLRQGDRVRVSSASDSTEGVLLFSERVRPGVIAGTHHFGHTQQGTSDWEITNAATAVNGGNYVNRVLHGMSESPARGDRVVGDKRRASEGFNVNDAMRRNDELDDTPLVDNAGGATIFLDTRVKVEAV